jgi:L-aspartate oxidase
VHGANRLASNSLLEGLVFGRRAAQAIAGADGASVEGWQRKTFPGDLRHAEVVLPEIALHDAAGTVRRELRRTMWELVSLRRDATGLKGAVDQLADLARSQPADAETANMLVAAQLIAWSALARHESRGAHYRTDHPGTDEQLDGRHSLLSPLWREAPNHSASASAAISAAPGTKN